MRLPIATVLAFAAVCAAAAPKEGDDRKSALGPLQGTWKLESGEVAGRALPKEILDRHVSLVVAKDLWTDTLKGKENGPGRLRIRLDPSKSPKLIDFVEAEPEDGKEPSTHLGIYEVEGDTLKVRVSRPRMPRPKDFRSRDTNTFLRVFKRQPDVPF